MPEATKKTAAKKATAKTEKPAPAAASIYEALANARAEFHELELKKTGTNKYAEFDYFELGDFVVDGMRIMLKHRLVPITTFDRDMATMVVFHLDSSATIKITSPMITGLYETESEKGGVIKKVSVVQGASLKTCHPIQNLGAVETYQRRYLWVTLLEIVEHDALDATAGTEETRPEPEPDDDWEDEPAPKAKPKAKAKPEPAEEAEEEDNDEPNLETEEDAHEATTLFIQLAETMHSDSISSLVEFWEKNKKVIDYLDQHYPDEYKRLKKTFTAIKSNLKKERDADE